MMKNWKHDIDHFRLSFCVIELIINIINSIEVNKQVDLIEKKSNFKLRLTRNKEDMYNNYARD